MEEKKFFMPPPPRELQRNNPNPPQTVEKPEEKVEELNPAQVRQEAEPVSFDKFDFSTTDNISDNSAISQMVDSEAKDLKVDKKNYKLKLVLSCVGLAVSVALFGVCIFFLIK